MIPKILHYCWFGRGQMGPVALKCMESWKKYCPDYQIKVWNEDNFDIGQNTFVKEAYEEKKWAFVTDYVRLYALYTEGGIYLDSDIELLKNLDDLLSLGGVVTSYQDCTIPAAIMLAEKGNVWLQDLLSYYDNRHFRLPDGTLDEHSAMEFQNGRFLYCPWECSFTSLCLLWTVSEIQKQKCPVGSSI